MGEGILPEHINDDVLGRTLDKIYEYGCTELFNQIVLRAMKTVSFGNHILHTDTTNFSLHGNYENRDPELNTIEITYGHPKDMRWDLKRFVLSIVCNQEGIPLFVETLSGNASDKTTLVKTVKKIQKNLELDDKVYHIADSTIFAENVSDQLKLILQYFGLELSLETIIDVYSSQALDPHVNRERFWSEWWA